MDGKNEKSQSNLEKSEPRKKHFFLNRNFRIICDSWLCLEFPQPESGQSLLFKASNLRRLWNNLLANKLESLDKSVESTLSTDKREIDSKKLEYELWSSLAAYINSEILYTVKRLLPADLKVLDQVN